MLEHTALVNNLRENRERLGYTAFTENQNSFRLQGKFATLDMVYYRGGGKVSHRHDDKLPDRDCMGILQRQVRALPIEIHLTRFNRSKTPVIHKQRPTPN